MVKNVYLCFPKIEVRKMHKHHKNIRVEEPGIK